MRKSLTLSACAALGVAAVPLIAQTASPPTLAFEATPAQAAVHSLVSAINGSFDRSSFVGSAFSSGALQTENGASRLKWMNKLAADTGGLTVVSVTSDGGRMVEAIIRTKRGGKFGKIVLFTSSKEPGKISDLFVLAARDPAKLKAEEWPTGPLPLPRIASEIDRRVAALAAEDYFSGAVLVAKGDTVLFRRAYGFAEQSWRIPNRTDTAFHLGSVPKMFTAAAVMQLADQGKLRLNDPLSKWVPEFPHAQALRIKLTHLLTHSAGIGNWDGRQFRKPLTGAEAAATMTAALEFAPGARFQYSNAGFVLLGAVIEKATGKSYADALRDLVFAPAGMPRTGLWPVTAVVPNRATGYLRSEDDPLGLGPRYSNEQYLGYGADGSGGHYSTVDDMFAFLSALRSNRLVSPARTAEMLTPRLDFVGSPRPSKYGYGVNLGTCAGHSMFGHGGGGPNSGVASVALRTLDSDWTVIVLSNYDPPAADDLAYAICEFVAAR